MDIFEDLEQLLLTTYISHYKIEPKGTDKEKIHISFSGANAMGDYITRDVIIHETYAKDLYDLLFKGYLISKYDKSNKFQLIVSESNYLGIDFVLDGKRLSNKELESLYDKAFDSFRDEYKKVLDEVMELKVKLTFLSRDLRMYNLSVELSKKRLRNLINTSGKRLDVKKLVVGEMNIEPFSKRQVSDINDILEITKKENNRKITQTEIIGVVNMIIKQRQEIDIPVITGNKYDTKRMYDSVMLLEILRTTTQKLEEAIAKTQEMLYEVRAEYEQLVDVSISIKRDAFLGSISREEADKKVSESELDLTSGRVLPEIDIPDDVRRYSSSPFVSSIMGTFQYRPEQSKEEVDKLNALQNQELTYEEKFAVNLYKSQLYRAFNNIIRYMKSNGLSTDQLVVNDDILEIIKEAYDELYKLQTTLSGSLINRRISDHNLVIDDYFDTNFRNGTPTLEQYKELILKYYTHLISAFSKIVLDEDMTVYRGISGDDLDFSGIISTSLDPKVTSIFRQRIPESKTRSFIRIKIPKGSPVIVFTNDLLKKRRGTYDDNLRESQKEIAFNSDLFDVVSYDKKTEYITDNDGKYVEICYFDITLRPKVQSLQMEELGTKRS